jgi:hypothetical protein
MEHYLYSVSDPADARFFASAVVEEEELLIDIRTELASGERSAGLNASGELRRILAHFFPRYQTGLLQFKKLTYWC